MITLGLTGSIGMGKSTTAQLFRDAGVPVFDADATVHALYGGEAVPLLDAAFPGVAPDGAVDRARLRERVIGDTAALRRLESIVHPLVRARRDAFLREARASGAPVAVLDIPLLFETGGDRDVDAVVVVSAPEAVQRARVLARPGMTEATLSAILRQQVPDDEKRRRAHYIIDTGHGIEEARMAVGAVLGVVTGKRD